ncbi:MAG: VOC family protein [Candidatus Latescibacteria bacterium]|nr:VOC family protein [Candidatus Latescibacterota bacterium]
MAVKPIPDGYATVTPYLVMKGAAGALDFYKKAFGAEERLRLDSKGMIMHAEIVIGKSVVMLADEFPDMGYVGPQALGGTPVSLMIYVENVDDVFARAIAAGAKEKRPVNNEFYGDRVGTLVDPYGHVWSIATHVEDVAPDEMERRFRDVTKQMGG